MTRSEIEAAVRSVERKCKGNFVHSRLIMDAVAKAWDTARFNDDITSARELVSTLAQVTGLDCWIRTAPWVVLEDFLTRVLYRTKDNCGADFNDVILANPLDGKDHVVPCPKCGESIAYTAPLFE